MNSFITKLILLLCFCIAILIQLFILLYYYTNPLPHSAAVDIAELGTQEAYDPHTPPLYRDIDISQLRIWRESSADSLDTLLRASALLPRIKLIVRMKTPNPEVFRNYIAPVGLPVVFTDMIRHSVLKKWNWGYIRSKYGQLQFGDVRQGNYTDEKSSSGKKHINRVKMSIKDFVDIITGLREAREGEELVYFAKKGLISAQEFGQEIGYPPFYGDPENCFLTPSVWMGMPGTYTQGHFDSKDNFVYQIIGRKRWTLFSPQDHHFLYIVSTKGSLEWSSALETLGTPDKTKFPLFENANPIQVTLNPGEVLYLPRGWVHAVENMEPSFMLNLWRNGPAEILKLWSRKAEKQIDKNCPSISS